MGRVPMVARRYLGCGVSFDDLLSAGNVGLVEAALRFDPQRKVLFTTYADWWIRKSILSTIQQQMGAVRLPRYRMEQIRQIRELRSELRSDNGADPTVEELAEAAGMDVCQIRTLLGISNTAISLDQPVGAGATRTVGECIACNGNESQDETIIRHDEIERVRELLDTLTAREQQILSLRFGFVGDRPMSLREIGACVGVSRERVRQIEQQTLKQLRLRMTETERTH